MATLASDYRLLIKSIPSLKEAELCPFLENMNETEKAVQGREKVAFDQAMKIRNYYDNIGYGCGFVSILPLMSLGVKALIEDRYKRTSHKDMVNNMVYLALAVGCFIAGMVVDSFYFGNKAKKVNVPNYHEVRWARLDTQLKQIKARIASSDDAAEKQQLYDARLHLKWNKLLFAPKQ